MLPFTLNFAVLPFFRVTVFLFKVGFLTVIFTCPLTPLLVAVMITEPFFTAVLLVQVVIPLPDTTFARILVLPFTYSVVFSLTTATFVSRLIQLIEEPSGVSKVRMVASPFFVMAYLLAFVSFSLSVEMYTPLLTSSFPSLSYA